MKVNLKKAQRDFVQELKDKNRSGATIAAYTKDLDQLITHLLEQGVTAVEEVETGHLNSFIDKMYETYNLTHKSVSRKINSIKSFYKHLSDKGHVKNNPADDLKHPKLDPKTPKIFSKVEYMAIREVSRKDIKSHAIVELLLQTGIRISELSLLEVEHLDLSESATLFIPKRESQKERVVPLNNRIKEVLSNYLEKREQTDSPFLFSTKSGKAMLIRNIRSSIDRLFKRAGVDKAKVNDFRHTFTAHQLAKGVSIKTVCRVAGHKTLATTQKYLKYMEIEKPGNKETLEEL